MQTTTATARLVRSQAGVCAVIRAGGHPAAATTTALGAATPPGLGRGTFAVGLDRDLTARTGPRIYRPRSPLADYVEFIGDWRSSEADYWSRALPRGAVTVVLDVGQRQQLDFYAADGAPWIFGSDTPDALAEDRGWTGTVTDAAEPGNRWGRRMHPPVPADVPGAPRLLRRGDQGLGRV